MPKKTFSTYKKAVKDIIKEAKYIMLIGHWNIDINFLKEDNEDNINVAGCIDVLPKYFSANVRIYPIHFEIYKDNDDYLFVKTIIHELCHIITEPLYLEGRKAVNSTTEDYIETIREQTTEQIANIIYNLWKKK